MLTKLLKSLITCLLIDFATPIEYLTFETAKFKPKYVRITAIRSNSNTSTQ